MIAQIFLWFIEIYNQWCDKQLLPVNVDSDIKKLTSVVIFLSVPGMQR